MFTFTDEALVLSVDKYGDHDAIVSFFCHGHGLARGVVKRGMTSKNRADVQPATQVEATWKARLPEHLGTLTLEAKHSYAARVMQDPLKLTAVGSAMALLSMSLGERDPHPELYAQTITFLQHVAVGEDPLVWLSEYVRLELALLELAGFGLDLSCCAATGAREDLRYVSPKSGRAVSAAAGEPYHDRMLALPDFIKDTNQFAGQFMEVGLGMALTGHFLERRLFYAIHRPPPAIRLHFMRLLERQAV